MPSRPGQSRGNSWIAFSLARRRRTGARSPRTTQRSSFASSAEAKRGGSVLVLTLRWPQTHERQLKRRLYERALDLGTLLDAAARGGTATAASRISLRHIRARAERLNFSRRGPSPPIPPCPRLGRQGERRLN